MIMEIAILEGAVFIPSPVFGGSSLEAENHFINYAEAKGCTAYLSNNPISGS